MATEYLPGRQTHRDSPRFDKQRVYTWFANGLDEDERSVDIIHLCDRATGETLYTIHITQDDRTLAEYVQLFVAEDGFTNAAASGTWPLVKEFFFPPGVGTRHRVARRHQDSGLPTFGTYDGLVLEAVGI